MDNVPQLVGVFGPSSARRILSSKGVNFSNQNLFYKMQRCGAHLERRGSPKRFVGWPYLYAARPRTDVVCMWTGGLRCRRTVLPAALIREMALAVVDEVAQSAPSQSGSDAESESTADERPYHGYESEEGWDEENQRWFSSDSGSSDDSDPGEGEALADEEVHLIGLQFGIDW